MFAYINVQTIIMNILVYTKHSNLIFLTTHRGKNNKDKSKDKTDLKIYKYVE